MSVNSKTSTLFVAIGTNPFDSLLQAVDTPSFYDALVKNSFNRIVFQCLKYSISSFYAFIAENILIM